MKTSRLFLISISVLISILTSTGCSNVVADALGEPFDSGWVGVNNSDSLGISRDPDCMAYKSVLTVHDSKLYAAWTAHKTDSFLCFAVFNSDNSNPSWNSAGTVHYNNTVDSPALISFNGKLYAFWTEGGVYQLRAAVYNGNDSAPIWNFIDGNTPTGLNHNSTCSTYTPYPFVFNSKLYLSWIEYYGGITQSRIAVYNGNDSSPAWTFVDGNNPYGINKDTGQYAYGIQLSSINGKLYAAWSENSSEYNYGSQIRVAVYNGNDSSPTWTFIDGNSYTGLNRDPLYSAYSVSLLSTGNTLHALWIENTGLIQQIRSAVYNGNDSSPAWSYTDGNHPVNGINYAVSKHAVNIQGGIHNLKIYAAWTDNNQVHVAEYNGNNSSPAWRFIDGRSSKYGINCPEYSYGTYPALASFNSFLYCTFIFDPGPAWHPYVKYWAAE